MGDLKDETSLANPASVVSVVDVSTKVSVIQQTEMPDLSSEMYEGVRVLNMQRAKSVLRRELFEWLKTSIVLKQLRIQAVQVAFTKCGRFAVLVERSKLKSFGLRLAVLDPHHQLTTYLLGVSTTLESALLHSAARIKQIEDDMDDYERTFKHGDVIHVEHLGYSHVAVYDAEREVFYELIGDIDSGKDAVLAELNNAHSVALQWKRDLKAATEARLTAALAMFRTSSTSCSATATSIVSQVTHNLVSGGSSIASSTVQSHSLRTSIPSDETHPLNELSPATMSDSSLSTSQTSISSTGSLSGSTSSSTPTPPVHLYGPSLTMTSTTTKTTTTTKTITTGGPSSSSSSSSSTGVPSSYSSSSSSSSTTGPSSTSASSLSPTQPILSVPPPIIVTPAITPAITPIIPVLAPKPVFRRANSHENISPRSRRSLLMSSGHVLSSPRSESSFGSSSSNSAFYNENLAYDPILDDLSSSSESERETDGAGTGSRRESFYDVKSHLQEATMHLRQLASSWDDIGLKNLLDEEESNFLTSAERDESIEPDDMCPAMAFGFPSHSIAEVQATPKDSFLTRDPLLRKRVQFYANALPPHVVIVRARSAVGSPGWNPITRNCEHFATWAKTGKTVSTQVFEIGSNAAIVGASTLQTIVTLAFLGLTLVWFIGRFVSGSSLIETTEYVFSWLLKAGVLVSSIVFALGLLIHWGNGSSADFDSWVQERRSQPPSPNASNPPSPHSSRPTTPSLVQVPAL